MDFLDGNPYFSAGFGLTCMGAAIAFARKGAVQGAYYLRRYYVQTLEVTSKDPSYPWLLKWLNTQSLSSASTMRQHVSVETKTFTRSSGELATKFHFVPSPGTHMVSAGGRWMVVERTREKQMVDFTSGTPWETVKLSAIGRDPSFFEHLLKKAQQEAFSEIHGKTCIYTSWGTEWRPFGNPRRKRPLDSVILESDLKQKIVDDVKNFINSAQWYVDRGIPYRRGYLLHGTPGSGKSSFIMALAGEIGYNICMVNLNERGMTDDRLAHSLSTVPAQSIVLLEDIDAAFASRKQDDKFGTNVTFSGLLNTLDGVVAGEERIVFMTTNHIEVLDPALIRPGRADVIHRLGPATQEQIVSLFSKFFPEENLETSRNFADCLKDSEISMAALQGYFMVYKDNAVSALENLADLINNKNSAQPAKTSSTVTI